MSSLSSKLVCSYAAARRLFLPATVVYTSRLQPIHTTQALPRKNNRIFRDVIRPQKVKVQTVDDGVGSDFTGPLDKQEMMELLRDFFTQPAATNLAMQCGLNPKTYREAFVDFRRYCAKSKSLPSDLHIKLHDLISGQGPVMDLFPYFLNHAKKLYPHLEYMEDLRLVADLTNPAAIYPLARKKQRKIIFHVGPTNSGKTHHAFQRFLESKSGIYCGPLKMLAVEIHKRSNELGQPCDLVTGEERVIINEDKKTLASHVSCTVEMADIQSPVEVAIIDEIQMLRDEQRGWAWLRAFLGVLADEVHVCGESTVADMLKSICLDTGDDIEIKTYERLTPIEFMNNAVETLDNVEEGDCIVCFSKTQIYYLCRELEKLGKECAVIYGSLPPGTKTAQAARFNDPSDPCKVLVATDAIGMGLNLNIRRIIFFSLVKIMENEYGEKVTSLISTSQALQIAGRSGRFGTTHESKGYVTTFYQNDIEMMHKVLSAPLEPISRVGIHPNSDQLELFAYYLPDSPLFNLIDIFESLSTLDDDKYFMCNLESIKQISEMLEHIPLALKTRYLFCCSPISLQSSFATSIMLKYARRFGEGYPITVDWLAEQLDWPYGDPQTLAELTHLETLHDSLDLYQWLSYRFPDQFPDREKVKLMQIRCDEQIQQGVLNMNRLVSQSESQLNHQESGEESMTQSEADQIGKIQRLKDRVINRKYS